MPIIAEYKIADYTIIKKPSLPAPRSGTGLLLANALIRPAVLCAVWLTCQRINLLCERAEVLISFRRYSKIVVALGKRG
jgi:hypothetical protein